MKKKKNLRLSSRMKNSYLLQKNIKNIILSHYKLEGINKNEHWELLNFINQNKNLIDRSDWSSVVEELKIHSNLLETELKILFSQVEVLDKNGNSAIKTDANTEIYLENPFQNK